MECLCRRKDSQATARVFALEGTEAGLEDLDKEGGTKMDWMEDLDEEDLHDMITGEANKKKNIYVYFKS